MKLNLETKNKEQEVLKEYLENNVSEILADKINNGVYINKDGKRLLNKKDLDSFIQFATEEARKQVEKGATSACIHSDIVFGWAIHYFEEDSIEGKLYNEDGSEYKTAIKTVKKPTPVKIEPKVEKPKQSSLFDLLSVDTSKQNKNLSQEIAEDNETEIEQDDYDKAMQEQDEELFGTNNLSKNTQILQNKQQIDYETGEIITKQENTQTFDKDLLKMISGLLDGQVIIK